MQKNLILSRLLISILIASTAGLAGIVAAKTIQTPNNESPNQNVSGTVQEIVVSPTPTVTSKPSTVPTVIPTTFPLAVTPSATPTPMQSTGCVVTISGLRYDVTFLRNTHSGGDVFRCGTDMTTIYQNKHGSNMGWMQGYLIGTNGVAPNPSPATTRREREDDD